MKKQGKPTKPEAWETHPEELERWERAIAENTTSWEVDPGADWEIDHQGLERWERATAENIATWDIEEGE